MSSYLATALGQEQGTFRRLVDELENRSGCPSEDVRLASELISETRQKIASLGLDPNDTTSEELYGALNAQFTQTRTAIARSIGQTNGETYCQLLSHFETKGVWTPKPAFLKKALSAHPPKKLMKALHYRTAESMLKRENPAKIAAAAELTESPSWKDAFQKQIHKVASSGWQIGPISVLLLEKSPWTELPGKNSIQISGVAGSIILRPDLSGDSDTFCLTLRLIQSIGALDGQSKEMALRIFGNPHKLDHHPTNGMPLIKVGGLSLGLSEYELEVDESTESDFPENRKKRAGPDLWTQFCKIHPALDWWRDTRSLIYVDSNGEAVSLNLSDVAKNTTDRETYPNRTLEYGRRRLEDSLAEKYSTYVPVGEKLSETLATDKTSPQERLNNLRIRYGTAFAIGSI